jgi:hypothetical protein
MFAKNVGTPDRVARAILGLVLLALPLFGVAGPVLVWLLPVIGLVLLGTASLSFCPIYRVLGLSSRPRIKGDHP